MSIDPQPIEAPVLVTGAAGFIGAATARALADLGVPVVGIDNLNDYYDPGLKHARLESLKPHQAFTFERCDLADLQGLQRVFETYRPRMVVNLGAQAGVRFSLENPHPYVQSNLTGFVNILECCRHHGVAHLVYASTSSVYGANPKQPFSVNDNVDHPVSLYAATKKSNELLAHSYAHLFGLPVTGLRFFTVYGPWGRPDMAYWIFTKNMLEGRPLQVANGGDIWRDFTYVDDVVKGVIETLKRPPAPNPHWKEEGAPAGSSAAPYRVHNIGRGQPEHLLEMIDILERLLDRKAERVMMPLPPGDVQRTWADTRSLEDATGYRPTTALNDGLREFVKWYRGYHRT